MPVWPTTTPVAWVHHWPSTLATSAACPANTIRLPVCHQQGRWRPPPVRQPVEFVSSPPIIEHHHHQVHTNGIHRPGRTITRKAITTVVTPALIARLTIPPKLPNSSINIITTNTNNVNRRPPGVNHQLAFTTNIIIIATIRST